MPSISLRGLPGPVHQALRTAADDAHRSLNSEILYRLEASFDPNPRRLDDPSRRGPPRYGHPRSGHPRRDPGTYDSVPFDASPPLAGPPLAWRIPPARASEVRESRSRWGRESVDATTTPIVTAVSGHTSDLERRSVMLIGSEPDDGWLNLEWHGVRVKGEEAFPSGRARLSIDGLAQAGLGGEVALERTDLVALVSDIALDALAESRPDEPPLRRISRFDPTPRSTLLLLRIDPYTHGQLEAVRERTRLSVLRDQLDRLLGIEVEIDRPGGLPRDAAEAASDDDA